MKCCSHAFLLISLLISTAFFAAGLATTLRTISSSDFFRLKVIEHYPNVQIPNDAGWRHSALVEITGRGAVRRETLAVFDLTECPLGSVHSWYIRHGDDMHTYAGSLWSVWQYPIIWGAAMVSLAVAAWKSRNRGA